MLTTSRRFASVSFFFAASSPSSTLFASSISSSVLRSGTLPISFKYMRTGSSVLTPSSTSTSSMISTSSSSLRMISSSSPRSRSSSFPLSSMPEFTTSMLDFSRYSRIWSILSSVSSKPRNASLISLYSRTFFLVFASSTSPFRALINCSCCIPSIIILLTIISLITYHLRRFLSTFAHSSGRSPAFLLFCIWQLFSARS